MPPARGVTWTRAWDARGVATLEDARRIALALPATSEKVSWGSLHWRVRDRGFAWERPLRKADLAALGDDAPTGEILGVRVADEGEKQSLVAAEPDQHGRPAVEVRDGEEHLRLDAIDVDELTEVITDAWLDRAPATLRDELLRARQT